ncbi:hypothetical protein T11_10866, partial [Trichinella zimbabwensis]
LTPRDAGTETAHWTAEERRREPPADERGKEKALAEERCNHPQKGGQTQSSAPTLTPPMQGQKPLTGPLKSGAGSHPLTSGEENAKCTR